MVTRTAMRASQVENSASPRNAGSDRNASTKTVCTRSSRSGAGPHHPVDDAVHAADVGLEKLAKRRAVVVPRAIDQGRDIPPPATLDDGPEITRTFP